MIILLALIITFVGQVPNPPHVNVVSNAGTEPPQNNQNSPIEYLFSLYRHPQPGSGADSPHQQPKENPQSAITNVGDYSTLAIACFTFLTIFVFLWQIRDHHRTERAWIVIEKVTGPPGVNEVDPVHVSRMTWFHTLKNHGKTPGIIRDVRIRFCAVHDVNKMPTEPDYGNGQWTICTDFTKDGAVIVPGAEFKVSNMFEPCQENGNIAAGTLDRVRQGKITLVCFGHVIYEDAFNKPHETRFCFVGETNKQSWDNRIVIHFNAGGPPEYNKCD